MKNKKLLVLSTVAVLMGTTGAVFFNAKKESALCVEIQKATSGPDLKLDNNQIIKHTSERFGFGLNPISSINAKTILCNLADEIENPAKYPAVSPELSQFAKDNHSFPSDAVTKDNQLIPTFFVTASGQKINVKNLNTLSYTNTSYKQVARQASQAKRPPKESKNDTPELKANRLKAQGVVSVLRKLSRQSTPELRLLTYAVGNQQVNGSKVVDRQVNFNGSMGEFWFNHFNVSLGKTGFVGHGNTLATDGYETMIHNRMHSTFYNLLKGVITHPAMIHYLDNGKNVYDPTTGQASNQNLGRELLELHTFGEPQGRNYNQNDVVAASLMLTGLNYDDQNSVGTILPRLSAPGAKICQAKGQLAGAVSSFVNCQNSKAPDLTQFNNRLDGYLRMLASHPRTKQHICRKLVSRFVRRHKVNQEEVLRNDVITQCEKAYGDLGNLKNMYIAIVTHPNTWHADNFGNYLKNPMELAISAARHFGISVSDAKLDDHAKLLKKQIEYIGLPFRQWTTPDGYEENGYYWRSQGYFVRWAKASTSLGRKLLPVDQQAELIGEVSSNSFLRH
jgi:uncharacterized protein (DUF1800 family)